MRTKTKTKVIGRHKYTLGKCFPDKRHADWDAKAWRREGHFARVIKCEDEYCVYHCWHVRW